MIPRCSEERYQGKWRDMSCHSYLLCHEDRKILKSVGVFICIIQHSWLRHQAEQHLLSALLCAAHFAEPWRYGKYSRVSSSLPPWVAGRERGADTARLPKSTNPWTWRRSWPCLIPAWHKWEVREWVWSTSPQRRTALLQIALYST